MKKTLEKLLVCILIVLTLNNFFISNITYAAEDDFNIITEAIEDLLGTVIGLLSIIPKLVVLPLSYAAQMLMAGVAYSQGTSDADGNISTGTITLDSMFLTPFDIIFNKVALVDVNIFNIPSTAGAIKSIREAVASWYYVMRNIAAAILLCILIYVGIRMAISTIASDRAAYKKMLTDWAVSLALIFLIQYIIVFTFSVNSAFIKALSEIGDATALNESTKDLFLTSLGYDLNSVAATVVVCMLTWQTFSLLITYIQRMLKVSFLVIISPLITLTYSIDKMGDGKAQALNTWLKEFVYTVLLQPFHCIVYMAFVGMAIKILGEPGILETDDNNFAAMILIILCIHFTKEAEKLLGKIFNFSDAVSGASLATGMASAAVLASQSKNIGKGARSVVNGAKNLKSSVKTARVEMATLKGIMAGQTIDQARQAATEKYNSTSNSVGEEVEAKSRVDKFMEKTAIGRKLTATKGALAAAREQSKAASREKAIEREMDKNGGSAFKRDANGRDLETEEQYNARRAKAEKAVDDRAKAKQQRRENIKNAKTFIAQSKTKNMVTQQVIPAMVSVGVGAFVGAGNFGVGGNAAQSVLLASGTYKGSQQFLKTSSKNMSTNTAALVAGAGAQSDAEGREKIEQVMGRSDEFEKASEQIDKIYGEIKAALDGIDKDDAKTLKNTIRNVVDKELLQNPSADNATIAAALAGNQDIQRIVGKHSMSMDDFTSSRPVQDMIDFKRDNKIYENITTVNSWGLSTDAMIDETMGKFNPTASGQSPQGGGQQGGGANPQTPPTPDGGGGASTDDGDGTDGDNDSDGGAFTEEERRKFEEIVSNASDEQMRQISSFIDDVNSKWEASPNAKANEVIEELEGITAYQSEQIKELIKLIKRMDSRESFTGLYQSQKSKIDFNGGA